MDCRFHEESKEEDPQNGIPVIPEIIRPYKAVRILKVHIRRTGVR